MTQTVRIEIEADVNDGFLHEVRNGPMRWASDRFDGVAITITPSEEGEGFGFTQVLSVVVEIGVDVASSLVAEAIRSAITGVIRRARNGEKQREGSIEGLTELIDEAREADTRDDDGEADTRHD